MQRSCQKICGLVLDADKSTSRAHKIILDYHAKLDIHPAAYSNSVAAQLCQWGSLHIEHDSNTVTTKEIKATNLHVSTNCPF